MLIFAAGKVVRVPSNVWSRFFPVCFCLKKGGFGKEKAAMERILAQLDDSHPTLF